MYQLQKKFLVHDKKKLHFVQEPNLLNYNIRANLQLIQNIVFPIVRGNLISVAIQQVFDVT